MKQHDIKELFPFLKEGWVACDKCGAWYWYKNKPIIDTCMYYEPATWKDSDPYNQIWIALDDCFNIAPYSGNWKDSLMKVEVAE